MDEEFDTTEEGLTSRAPRQKGLAALARELNRLGAEYIVIGDVEASKGQITREVDGVPIPFASPRLLYRMKVSGGLRFRP
jgi:hypothetical protein